MRKVFSLGVATAMFVLVALMGAVPANADVGGVCTLYSQGPYYTNADNIFAQGTMTCNSRAISARLEVRLQVKYGGAFHNVLPNTLTHNDGSGPLSWELRSFSYHCAPGSSVWTYRSRAEGFETDMYGDSDSGVSFGPPKPMSCPYSIP